MKAIEIERETITEEMYIDMLNEQGDITIGCLTFSPADILKQLDPVAYRCGLSDCQEYETVYECPICGEEHEDEEDAEECCQYRCVECGELYEIEEGAENCCACDE